MNWLDNGVTRFLGKVADFMILNILWIVCSIPIITIGVIDDSNVFGYAETGKE